MYILLMFIYTVIVGILPTVLWGYNVMHIEWWVIAIPMNIIGNAIIKIAYDK